jgi:hypothetical protein
MKKLLWRFLILNLGISIVLDVTSVPAIAVARPAAVRADGEPEIWSTVYPVWKHRFGIPDTCTRIRAHLAIRHSGNTEQAGWLKAGQALLQIPGRRR